MTPDEMAARLAEMSELGLWEWQIHRFDGDSLLLAGGQNMVYGHHAEATFARVTYISCPTRVMHPVFRLATGLEAMPVHHQAEVEHGAHVIAIDSDTTASLGTTSFLVARSVELVEGYVDYHRNAGTP